MISITSLVNSFFTNFISFLFPFVKFIFVFFLTLTFFLFSFVLVVFVLFQVSSNLCMPYWIRDQEGRLVRIENPQDTELDICVNIMDPPPED